MEIRICEGPFYPALSDALQVVITLTELTCQKIVAVYIAVATGTALFLCACSGQVVVSELRKEWHLPALSLLDHSAGFLKIA